MRLPRCGRIRLVSSGARFCSAFRNRPALAEFVFVRRVRQQLHGFGIGSFFLCGVAGKIQALECVRVGEKETVVEGKLVSMR